MSFEPILYGPLFVRDAQDVNLVAAGEDTVDVTVAAGGSSWTIPVTPVLEGGRYVAPLRMREILASVVEQPGLADAGVREVPLVTLSAGDTSMAFRAVYGGAAGKTPAQLVGHWLSWRDQVSKTYTWGRERLTFLAGLDLLGWRSGSYSVSAKVYFLDADPVTLSLASGTLQAGCQFVTVDASFAAIAARVSGIPAAWDISYAFSGTDSDGAAASIEGYPLRLVVARADVRVKEFVFCNGFGVEDRVFSSGRSNPKLEGSSVAFLNGSEESELRNDAEEGREVYSGYLGSARESALWLDFLKAYDRRILLNGIPEKIVVDSQETDLQDNAIGSVKFTYHLAYLDAGRYFQDAEGLGDFDPNQQYGALYVGDDPASEDLPVEDLFFLKTRLDEFPAVDLTEELLFLVQNPLTRAWGNVALSGVKDWLQQAIHAERTPVWSGPWEDYRAGVAGFALAAALGKNLDDRIRAIERSPFVLPVATATVLGGIKVGEGLSIDGNGVLSVENPGFFQKSADLTTLIELKPDYAYLGTRKGLIFEANAETDTNADFEKVQITIDGQTVTALHSKLPFFSDSWISAGGISPGGGASAGNATLVAQTYGGTLSATGIDPINFYSKERVDQLLATAGTVQTVAGVSPTSGDIPVASLKSALGLGAAAEYGIGSVASGNTGLVTGGSVYSAINEAVSSVMKMQGTTTTPLSDGSTTNPVVIDGSSYTAKKGDVVLYDGKEYLWAGSAWEQLGDEASWALKTTTISAGTGLEGGGTLASNRTISLSAASIASLDLADSAYQKPSTGIPQTDLASALSTKIDHGESAYTNLNDWFEIVDGNIHVKGNRGFYSDSFISAGGLSDGGGSAGVDLAAVWNNLIDNTGEGLNKKIHTAHLPTVSITGTNISGTGTYSGTGGSASTLTLNLTAVDTTYSPGAGLSLSGTTFSNSGVRSTTINGNYLRVNTNGTNADLTIPYAVKSTYITSPFEGYPDDVITDETTSAELFKENNGTLFPVFHRNAAGVYSFSDTLYWSGYNKFGGTELVTQYNAASNVGVKIRKYTHTLNSWGAWTTFITDGNYTSYVNTTNFPGLNKTGTVTSIATGTGLTGGTITSTGTVSINSTYQGYISHGESAYNSLGNYVLKAGDTMNGSLTFNQPSSSRRNGIIGTYDPNRAADIWSIGASYQIDADGMSMGNLYGACYVYYGSGYTYGAGKSGGHSFVWAQGGSPTVALGNNVWTSGGFIKNGGTSSQFLKADGSVDSTSYYYSGNLSLATLAGSTQIGSSTQPVYYNGSALAACNLSTTYAPYNSAGYLPLNGGTLTGSLIIDNIDGCFVKNFKYHATTGWARDIVSLTVDGVSKFVIGAYGYYTAGDSSNGIGYAYIGVNNYNGTNLRFGSDSTLTWGTNTIWHSGNSNLSTVPWACSTLTASGDISTSVSYFIGNRGVISQSDSTHELQVGPGTFRNANTSIYGKNIYFNAYNGSFQQLIWTTDGKFGIGTTTPSYKLDVNDTNSWATRFLTTNSIVHTAHSAGYGFYLGSKQNSSSYYLFSLNYGQTTLGTGGTSAFYVRADGNVGIGTESPSQKLHVVGNIVATGAITAGSASDARLKTNIQPLSAESAKRIVMALNPVTFTWNSTATEFYDQYKGNDLGFIAQEVEPYLPQAIGTIFEKYMRLDQTKVIAPLVAVAQDHETRIRQLERENAELKRRLNMN